MPVNSKKLQNVLDYALLKKLRQSDMIDCCKILLPWKSRCSWEWGACSRESKLIWDSGINIQHSDFWIHLLIEKSVKLNFGIARRRGSFTCDILSAAAS